MISVLTNTLKSLAARLRAGSQNGIGIPILCYHQIGREEGTEFPSIYLSSKDFERQIDWLVRHAYEFVSLDELVELIQQGIEPSARKVVLTFDDGYEGVYENAFPVLHKYACRASIFVIADRLRNQKNLTSFPFLNVAELREMMKYGISVGSHSFYHNNLASIRDENDLRIEIRDSKKLIEDLVGGEIRHFCYPLGAYDTRVVEMVENAGYASACSTNFGRKNRKGDLFTLKRVPIAYRQTIPELVYKMEILGWITS